MEAKKQLQDLTNKWMPKRYYGHEARKYAKCIAEEHIKSKLSKIVGEIESLKKTKDNFDSKSYNLTVDVAINVALDAAIEIIKKEIT